MPTVSPGTQLRIIEGDHAPLRAVQVATRLPSPPALGGFDLDDQDLYGQFVREVDFVCAETATGVTLSDNSNLMSTMQGMLYSEVANAIFIVGGGNASYPALVKYDLATQQFTTILTGCTRYGMYLGSDQGSVGVRDKLFVITWDTCGVSPGRRMRRFSLPALVEENVTDSTSTNSYPLAESSNVVYCYNASSDAFFWYSKYSASTGTSGTVPPTGWTASSLAVSGYNPSNGKTIVATKSTAVADTFSLTPVNDWASGMSTLPVTFNRFCGAAVEHDDLLYWPANRSSGSDGFLLVTDLLGEYVGSIEIEGSGSGFDDPSYNLTPLSLDAERGAIFFVLGSTMFRYKIQLDSWESCALKVPDGWTVSDWRGGVWADDAFYTAELSVQHDDPGQTGRVGIAIQPTL